MIKKSGNTWEVTTKSGGRVLGKHSSKKKAQKQLAAIEINKASRLKEMCEEVMSEKKKQKSTFELTKPRLDKLPPNKVEIDKKTKAKNPRKFNKYTGFGMADEEINSSFDAYLAEEGKNIITHDTRKEWIAALDASCGATYKITKKMGEDKFPVETAKCDETHKVLGKWDGFSGWTYKPVPKKIKESQIIEADDKFWVVLASRKRGRGNGSALIKAGSKLQAKQIAKDFWLDEASVDAVHPPEHNEVSFYFDDDGELDRMKAEIKEKVAAGKPPYVEIEWGT